MASRSSLKSIDLQELITEAARLELKTLNAGVEFWQVWINQAAKLSNVASDTLQAIQDDKASVFDTAGRLSEFGKENANVFGELSSRLSKSYFEELDRLGAAIDVRDGKPAQTEKAARRSRSKTRATAKKATIKAAPAKKKKKAAPAKKKAAPAKKAASNT
jgi:hypothetical protein